MPRPRHVRPRYRLESNRHRYWEVRWTEGGRTRSVSTRTRDRGEAEGFLARFEAGTTVPVIGKTISSILDAYLEARSDRPSYGTIKALAGKLKEQFGHLEPQHVTQASVKAYATWRLGQGRSPSTVVTDLIHLKAAVNWAIKQKLLPPSAKLTFEMPVRRSRPRDRWLAKAEVARLVESAVAPHVRLFILIGVQTFARRDAILELTWEQVDLKARRIDFGEGTGNKRRAIVPIPDRLHAELVSAHERAISPYVVEFGGSRITDVRRGLEAAARRAGVGHVHPHLLRHTGITWAVMQGEPLSKIARYAGTTEAMIERVYGHHSPDYLASTAAAVDF